MKRNTMTGVILILFFFAAWSIGNVMYLTPTLGGGTEALDFTFSWIWIPILLIILSAALYSLGRTPTYLAIPAVLVAMMISPYILLKFSFLWPVLVIVTAVLIGLWYLKGYRKRQGASAYLVVMLTAGILLFIVTYFGTGGEMLPIETGGDGEAPSLPWDDPGSFNPIESTFGSLGTFVLVLFVGAVLIFLLVQNIKPLLEHREEKEGEEEIEEDLSSTVDKAISELYQGKDVESTVLGCYQRMCRILEEKGVKDTAFTTPREFERRAVRTLHVPEKNISEIREVFEVAKYSTHELGGEERERAVEALKKLRKELE
ncbi:MAG: DUF4129 domain-containing protein [Candidatus Aenigmatarchaeota archaeon]